MVLPGMRIQKRSRGLADEAGNQSNTSSSHIWATHSLALHVFLLHVQEVCGDMGLSCNERHRCSQAGEAQASDTLLPLALLASVASPARAEPCAPFSAYVQELKTMVADDAVFKADGVIYTQDTKGTLGLPLSVRTLHVAGVHVAHDY